MATSPSPPNVSSARIDHQMPSRLPVFTRATRPIRTVAKAAIFFLKVFPMLPSRPVDWVTKLPVIEKMRYPTHFGQAEGDLYRPSGRRSTPWHRGVPRSRSFRRRSSAGCDPGESAGSCRFRGVALLVARDAGLPARSRGHREYCVGVSLVPRATIC